MKTKIILGHPFAGSLYMFFDQQLSDYPFKEPISHPYYRDLFGRNYIYWNDLAFTLFTIFDEVILPPADANIPDYQKYSSNGIYHNKDLGIYFDWKDTHHFFQDVDEQIKKDLEDPFVQKALLSYSTKEKEGILEYVRLYIKLSQKYNCPVLCGGTYQELFSYLVNNNTIQKEDSINTSVSFTKNYLNLSLASFSVSSLDSLYEIKSNSEIKIYSKNFQKIIHKYGSTTNTEEQMKILLKDSLSKDSFYNNVSSILDTSSIVCSTIGLIPAIGLPFSILSLGGTFLSSKLKRNINNWYQLVYSIDKLDKTLRIKNL